MRQNGSEPAEARRGLCIGVRGGIHDGAESELDGDEITIIGSAEDCNLRLADAGIAAHHLAIGASGNRLVVRPMDGQCSVNGRGVSAGQSATIRYGDRIALHDTDVWITLIEQSEDKAGHSGGVEQNGRRGSRRWQRTLSATVALVALVFVGFGSQHFVRSAASASETTVRPEDVLASLDIADEVSVSREGGVVTLHGVLPDDVFVKLQREARTLPRNVVNRTQSVSRLLEQVRGVFRTNGYHANLTYVGDAAVEVTNLDGENPKIQQVAGYARDDVAILSALTFAPVGEGGRSDKRLVLNATDPNKRLTTIVDGETAYVATTDGGRYFVGSVLPGGLILRDITTDGIQVDDNGEIHWLAL